MEPRQGVPAQVGLCRRHTGRLRQSGFAPEPSGVGTLYLPHSPAEAGKEVEKVFELGSVCLTGCARLQGNTKKWLQKSGFAPEPPEVSAPLRSTAFSPP